MFAMPRVIFHVDMDAFYASVEQRDNPALRGKPVIVGGSRQRGVVCAASYEARKFGVRSAMPSVTAARLCPTGIFIYPRMSVYKEESRAVFKILADTGAIIEPTSIDEAYLDLTNVVGGHGEPDSNLYAAVPIAKQLRQAIACQRNLTASIGVAANKLLAKLASDFQKPNGLTVVPERDKTLFLRPLKVRSLHGVGKVTEEILVRAGLQTIGDLQDYPGDLRALLGSFGPKLKSYSLGQDDRIVDVSDEIKSISSEETFDLDTDDRRVLRQCLRSQAQEISQKLERWRLGACTVQVKVRYGDFTTLTRQITVEDPVTEAREIYRLGCHLLARENLVRRRLRLLGLGVSGLGERSSRQLLLL